MDNNSRLPKGTNATFSKIKSWGGDKNTAMTFDNIKVERQELIYAEGYGMVKTCPTSMHFIYEDKSKKRGRWAFMCFPGDIQIDCGTTQKTIRDVVVGDSVLTHQNRYREVVKTFVSEYTGKMVEISTSANRKVTCTQDHPFMVLRGKDFLWAKAGEISKQDMLVEAIPSTEEIDFFEVQYQNGNGVFTFAMPLDNDSYRLFGYYLAEGYVIGSTENAKRKRHHVAFAFNKSESDYIQDVQNLMYKYFGTYGTIVKTSENGVRVSFTTQVGYEVFRTLLGKLAYAKTINPTVLGNTDEKLRNLILGYWRGDGSSSPQGFAFDSTSKDLIYQIQKCLYRFGIVSGITIRKVDKAKPSYIAGREVRRKHDLYTLHIYGASANRLANLLGEDTTFTSKTLGENRSKILGSVVLHKILDISNYEVDSLPVYNFEVDEDNSYHAENFIVHNCTCGSIAGIISYNELKSVMTIDGATGYVLACIAGVSSKQNTGIFRHADNSTE